MDCKVLKHSSCQSIYGCCSVCVPASFALFRKYKSQLMKMLSIISDNFLEALKAREEPRFRATIVKIQSYMEDKRFLKEPEGRGLQGSLLSECYGARARLPRIVSSPATY
ncbi:mRNA export factor GLE1-like [Corylus avellana]|uniref:mRNA export factor GLE1-like n=1 Tax=Corylus avellana TaxID=13451 RepID=UPI00286AFA72|nr:mRNA export factor GLE1-like [Corylus avellana]